MLANGAGINSDAATLDLASFLLPFTVLQLLSDIQEHLGTVIPEIEPTMDVPVDDFDGKVRISDWMMREGHGTVRLDYESCNGVIAGFRQQ